MGEWSEQDFDLLEIATGLSAELRAGPPQVVGAEYLDADLARRLLNDARHVGNRGQPSRYSQRIPGLEGSPSQNCQRKTTDSKAGRSNKQCK